MVLIVMQYFVVILSKASESINQGHKKSNAMERAEMSVVVKFVKEHSGTRIS